MAAARVHSGCVRLTSGKVFVVGGFTGDTSLALAYTEISDPVAGVWSAGPTMNQARGAFFFAAYGTDQFLAAGGDGGLSTTLSSAEIIKIPGRWV